MLAIARLFRFNRAVVPNCLRISKLHATPSLCEDSGESDEKQNVLKHTIKSRKPDANTLIKQVSGTLHPKREQFKERKMTKDDIQEYLHKINEKTSSRKHNKSKFSDGSVEGARRTSKGDSMSAHDLMTLIQQTTNKNQTGSPPKTNTKSTVDMRDVKKCVNTLLNGNQRLGIFSSKDVAKQVEVKKTEELGYKTAIDWWDEWEKESTAFQTKNHYQEMLEWAEKGRFPTFPIDNEVGMEKEKDVPFHKHIFLQDLIEEGFPKRGPIRQFMEAVILGLSKSPYLSVEEKEEHINWFREYFTEKLELLKTLGTIVDEEAVHIEAK